MPTQCVAADKLSASDETSWLPSFVFFLAPAGSWGQPDAVRRTTLGLPQDLR